MTVLIPISTWRLTCTPTSVWKLLVMWWWMTENLNAIVFSEFLKWRKCDCIAVDGSFLWKREFSTHRFHSTMNCDVIINIFFIWNTHQMWGNWEHGASHDCHFLFEQDSVIWLVYDDCEWCCRILSDLESFFRDFIVIQLDGEKIWLNCEWIKIFSLGNLSKPPSILFLTINRKSQWKIAWEMFNNEFIALRIT